VFREVNPGHGSGRWSRRDLAEWLLERITSKEPAVVGIDHAFSFPQSYMDRNNLRSWSQFLKDWPFDGFEVKKGKSVIAEVRPARLRHRYRKDGLSKEEQDAYAICAWLQERDQLGLLRPYFTPPLSQEEQERARLEGWILGVA
jgi:hypothetical protein